MDILTVNDRPGAYPPSYYAASVPLPAERPRAKGQLTCDVCVIGGGFTGLSAALQLAQRGYDVILLEAHRVGWGASGRNGGQVGSGQRVDQVRLEAMLGEADARRLWSLALDAVALVQRLIRDHAIDCHFVPGIIHADHRRRFVAGSRAYVALLREKYGYDRIEALDRQQIRSLVGSPAYYGGSLDRGAGHLHPLAYALGLAAAAEAAGARLFEGARASGVRGGAKVLVGTESAEIAARFLILGCNGYHGDLFPALSRQIMPINNFIAATEPLSETEAQGLIRHNRALADSRFVINYFRLSQDRRMLFGGGESYGYRFPAGIAAKVRKPMLRIFPQLAGKRIDYAWGGTLGITRTRLPDFRRLAGNILSAGGFSGHGVAMASLAGAILAEAVDGQASRFDIFARLPAPGFPGGPALRKPLLALAMAWYALRDRL
ncbi:MAG: FAD-binding oxidoreductase [Rhodospirillales bacterium]|nr:FAD-binding oxidoreductase [Rhodospirillales bacterium]